MILNAENVLKLLNDPEGKAKKAQHGVDLTLKGVKTVQGGEVLKEKTNLYTDSVVEVNALEFPGKEVYHLSPGTYEITFEQGCKLPNNVKANIIHRSSVLRTGSFILSGEYDPGFETANMGAFLFVTGDLLVEKGARVAQIIMSYTEESEAYNGQFQGK